MPALGDRKIKDGVLGEWDGTTWRRIAKPGDRKTQGGVTGEWDGTTWRKIVASSDTPEYARLPEPKVEQSGGLLQNTVDVAIGGAKSAVESVSGLGKVARDYIPGVSQLDRLMTPVQVNTTPTNTAQRVGFTAGQIGQFFIPVAGVAGKAKVAADVAKSGLLTMAQGGTPTEAGVSAALTAAIPAVGAGISRARRGLQAGAEKSMSQALGATKEWAKSSAKKLAPEMLKRGVRGSRAAMLERAAAQVDDLAPKLQAAYQEAAKQGGTVSGQVIRGHVQLVRDALQVPNAAGELTAVPGTERVISRLNKVEKWIESLGDDIPVDKAAKIKQAWDKIIDKAGLFGHRATASASEKSDAWALREASGAFRELLNKNTTISELNRELSFWIGLKKVLAETGNRTQAQGGGLVSGIAGTAGAISGFTSGESLSDSVEKAFVRGVAGRQLVRALQSPWFRTTAAAPFKKMLADALASGDPNRIASVVGKVTAAMPAQSRSEAPAQ